MSRSFNLLLYLALLLAVWSLAALAMRLLGAEIWGIDDAYIFFVYAENAANFNGFVYNVGAERVEGFSSLLWQLLLTAFYFVGWKNSTAFAILSGLLSALTLWAICDLLRRALQPYTAGCWSERREIPLPAVLAIGWLVAWPAWFIWNVASFMDVALWTCLLTLTVREVVLLVYASGDSSQGVRRISVLLFLLVLTRPETLAWAPFFIVSMAAVMRWKSEPLWPAIRLPCIVFCASMIGLTAFRLQYFGYPLPNTYYAKVAPDIFYRFADGFEYVGKFFGGGGFAALAVLVAAGWLLGQLPKLWSLIHRGNGFTDANAVVLFFLCAYVTAAFAIVILEGGDHFGSWRMLQPVYPVLPLLLICLWLHSRASRAAAAVATVRVPRAIVYCLLATLLLTAPVRGSWYKIHRTGLLGEFDVVAEGMATAKVLREIISRTDDPVLPVVAVTGAGGLKYAWQGPVLDLMGLNSVAMAHAEGGRQGLIGHAAFNKDVFFREAPEIVIPHVLGWPGIMPSCKYLQSTQSFYGYALNRLQADEEFKRQYAFVTADAGGKTICMYVKRSYLRRLRENGSTDFY